jgi:hypothetical protein
MQASGALPPLRYHEADGPESKAFAQALVESLLQVDAAQRLSAAAVRVHPWVLGVALPTQSPPPQVRISADARGWPAQPAAQHFSLEAQAELLRSPSDDSRPSLAAIQQLWQQQELLAHGEAAPACPLKPSGGGSMMMEAW